jgi:SSS family solute:Na+ symporter
VVKVGALAFILFLPTQYALDLQLLGGLWIVQTLPALVFGLFTVWFRAEGLLLGWAVGIGWGTYTSWSNGLKPLASISLGGSSYTFCGGDGRGRPDITRQAQRGGLSRRRHLVGWRQVARSAA